MTDNKIKYFNKKEFDELILSDKEEEE